MVTRKSLGSCFPKPCPALGGVALRVHAGKETIGNARIARRVFCLRVIDASCDESPSCVRESSTFPSRVKGIKTSLSVWGSVDVGTGAPHRGRAPRAALGPSGLDDLSEVNQSSTTESAGSKVRVLKSRA